MLTQAAAGGAAFVQGAALGERSGNGQRLLGAQAVSVHIHLHFGGVNPRAGMLLLSAGEKFNIGKKLGAFFAQLLHGGCNGNGQRYGTQNGLRFSTGCVSLNFTRCADRGSNRGIARVQVVADCFAEGVRHWFSFRCAPVIRGGVGALLPSRRRARV